MAFTDDDLLGIKRAIMDDEAQTGIRFAIPVNGGKLKALIHRLEAAEKALDECWDELECHKNCSNHSNCAAYWAWRKAKGEE